MKKIQNNFIYFLFFVIPFLLIYKNVFTSYPTAFGDAPYFYQQKLWENLNEPLIWDYRNSNFGAVQGHLLWLYLINFFAGFSYTYLGISEDLINKVLFYIPTGLASFTSCYIFLKSHSSNKHAIFLGSLFYTFNTYILSVLDGGQVGVALAYTIFPLSIVCLQNLLITKNIKNFIFSLASLFILSNLDIRIFLISFILNILFLIILVRNNILNNLKISFILYILVGLLNGFYLLPLLLSLKTDAVSGFSVSNLESLSLLHTLLVYHPNFPINEFGRIIYPPFYFLIIPAFISLGVLFKNKRKAFISFGFLYLLFVFLSKGVASPFGQIYSFVIDQMPLGFSFRDSTKFFIPLILVVSTLMVLFIENLNQLKNVSKNLIFIFCYLMILLFISPAITNSLTGGFGLNTRSIEYKKIATNISSEKDFARTLWFPEIPPMAYQDFDHPAISASYLFEEKPFSSMISGNYDLFFFLHNRNLIDWFRLLGIRYVAVDQNLRKKIWTTQEIYDRNLFLDFVDTTFTNKLNWSSQIPTYSIGETLPHFFLQDQVWLIVGGENVYDELFKKSSFKLENQGLVFSENQYLDLDILEKIDKRSLSILFNDTEKIDLTMSFLKDKIISTNDSLQNNYKYFASSSYLDWKYELLKNEINTKDLDFGAGVSTSTKKDELIIFRKKIKTGSYFIGVRFTNASSSAGINVSFKNEKNFLYNSKTDHFIWKIFGPVDLEDQADIKITNQGGFVAVNSIAIIPKTDYKLAINKTQEVLSKFDSYSLDNLDLLLKHQTPVNTQDILVIQKNPTKYIAKLDTKSHWLVFSDNYDAGWSTNNSKAMPFYNMINGFYLGSMEDKNLDIYYKPQEIVYKGIIVSLVCLFLISLGIIIIVIYQKKHVKH